MRHTAGRAGNCKTSTTPVAGATSRVARCEGSVTDSCDVCSCTLNSGACPTNLEWKCNSFFI